ncbi:uncharacterized protein LOC120844817 [Ixodes scapularis]|uniref:uncharacterized protein LOC120844817 n=1 Tax=Ixodes scapularis TaxID=6945 RepID=UPI001A9FDDB2|nr:uncharacterized protein LOC120844817 [Ixodes scapularis]
MSHGMFDCVKCRQINRRTTAKEGCLNPRDIPDEPNKVISLDHFGPMMEKEGNTHVSVCIVHATLYVDASAVPSTAFIHYINFLTKRWIPRFGVPDIIIPDQARGFVNRNTKRIHRRLGVTHTTPLPYWPEANGIIERMVGTIKQVQRKLVDNRLDWHIAVQDAITAVNVTRQSSTRYSPFWLMHGYDPKLPGDLNIGSVDQDITETERLLNFERSRCAAKQNLENSQTLAKARCETDVKAPCFNVGGFVPWTLYLKNRTKSQNSKTAILCC